MALSVGDAVLTFLGDTTQLDQAFNKVATDAGAKMGVATTAIQGTTGAVDEMAKSMHVGQQGAVELGEVTDLAGHKAKESMYEARGELGLLGEAFGIHLPRHVRSFVAELPGVGAAMSAAFQATAVVFLLAAFVEGIKKILEFAEASENMRQAWEKAALQLENLTIKEGDHTKSLELANLKLDDQIAKLENRPSSNKLSEALLETSIAADNLAARFSKDFEKMTDSIISTTSFTGQFSQSMSEIVRSSGGIGGNIGAVLAGGIAAAATGVIVVRDALKQVSEEMLKINELRIQQANAKTEEQQVAATRALAEAYGVLAQTSKNALGLVQLDAPTNIKLITDLSGVIIQATAAQRDFGLQSENVHKRVRLAVDESAKEQADVLKKKDQEVIKSINERITEEQKLYKRETDASLKSVEEQLAAKKKADAEELQLAHQKLEGQLAIIDGEMVAFERDVQIKEHLLSMQYKTGLLSHKQYTDDLRALYNKEAQDLIAALNRKEQLVIQEAKNEAAARGKIITDSDAKELKAYIDLENKKADALVKADLKIEKAEDHLQKDTKKRFAEMSKLYKAYEAELVQSGNKAAAWGAAVGNAISEVMQAYAAGSITITAALEGIVAAELKAVAQMAEVKGTEQLARAFGSWPDAAAMAQHFAAAALWFSLGGALSLAGGAMSGSHSGSGSGSGAHPQIDTSNPNTQPAPPGQGGRNVPHLYGGGLITEPTLAMVGDARSGGSAREGIMPLDDPRAMNEIATAIADRLGGGGNNFYVKGMVSADTLGKIAKKLSRQVQTGRARLVASNSHKLTRRA